jgi:eukaryotic-like serine/threonine-protein kinase
MPLSAGDKLGPYEIVALVGVGGMGEVYRARDPRLGRDVAIKVSTSPFSERFEREARAVAALNHPNICTLYDVGPNYLVMEFVEGEAPRGPLPLDEALRIARQIADALAEAHEKGITHRDLKPGNIKVKPDGSLKVLDFGLAKFNAPASAAPLPENSPTLTMAATELGVILGTAAYMSPEQARGKAVDKRADIWAFGVVLWELITGKRLFQGEDASHTMAAVIMQPVKFDDVPFPVRRLLRACVERDPKKRLRDIADVWALLDEEPASAPPEIVEAAPSRSRLGLWASVVAAAALLALGALAVVHFREQPPVAEVTRFQIPLPAGASFRGPFLPQEISPDGRKLAFAAVDSGGMSRIWIRPLDSLEARLLPGTEIAVTPLPFFWSWDSRFLAFFSPDRKLKKIDISGGPAQTLCEAANVVGGSWSPEGVILFGGARTPITRVSEAGGTPVALTALDPARQEAAHGGPKFLPDGRHFFYFRYSTTASNSGIYLGSIDAKPSEQPSQPLLPNQMMPEYYVPPATGSSAHLLFFREGTVLAQPFNASKLRLSGDPVPVAEQVSSVGIQGAFSASANGVLAFVGGATGAGAFQLTWLDRQGKKQEAIGEPGLFQTTVALSPDGKQAAVTRAAQNLPNRNLWLYDLTGRGAPARFTFDSSRDIYPVYSPDGSRIVFQSFRDGTYNLYQKLTNGAKNEELLLKSDELTYPYSWSRDGRFLAYTVQTAKTKDDIWILPMDGNSKPMLFQGTEFNETGAQFSPEGHWIAYQSNAGGRDEVYVREFVIGSDGKPEATPPHLVSAGGGSNPKWRDDGKELFYLSGDRKAILSVEISTKPSFQFSATKLSVPLPTGITATTVSGDGQRILIAAPAAVSNAQGNAPPQFTIVQNWQAGLKK